MKSKTNPIDPPELIYVVVKTKACKDHPKPSMQYACQFEVVAKVRAEQITPFGACGLCEYGVRVYEPARGLEFIGSNK